jgi:DNA-directed RNA polymerase subunit F
MSDWPKKNVNLGGIEGTMNMTEREAIAALTTRLREVEAELGVAQRNAHHYAEKYEKAEARTAELEEVATEICDRLDQHPTWQAWEGNHKLRALLRKEAL